MELRRLKDLVHNRDATEQFDAIPLNNSAPAALWALSVVYHPDVSRIGDYISISESELRRGLRLSRNTPAFSNPEGQDSRTLEDRYISRAAMLLQRRGDQILLDVQSMSSPVSVLGFKTGITHLALDVEALDKGVILCLARRVLLLLHKRSQSARSPMLIPSEILGVSSALDEVRRSVTQAAPLATDVLILGESGTGKELIARAIHANSRRAEKNLVAVNLAAIPPGLSSSELFGAEKGAYTGASKRSAGFFSLAEKGTLFLDEIGDAPPEVQAALLRAMESREIQPLGGEPRKIDVRIISATDADLDTEARSGSFKAALRHRLGAYEIRVPPLRDRLEDIAVLARHFLVLEFSRVGEPDRLSNDARSLAGCIAWADLFACLMNYTWPGNVRELRNLCRQIAIHSHGKPGVSLPAHIASTLNGDKGDYVDGAKAPESDEQKHLPNPATGAKLVESEVRPALEDCAWELAAAARQLGVSRQRLNRYVKASEDLRLAGDVGLSELEASYRDCKGDLDEMSSRLQVSRSGLQRRVRDLFSSH